MIWGQRVNGMFRVEVKNSCERARLKDNRETKQQAVSA